MESHKVSTLRKALHEFSGLDYESYTIEDLVSEAEKIIGIYFMKDDPQVDSIDVALKNFF